MFCFIWGNFLIKKTSAVLVLLANFACFTLTVKLSAINSLNSGVVMYLLWSGISFSTVIREAVVAKLVIWGMSRLTLFVLSMGVVLVA